MACVNHPDVAHVTRCHNSRRAVCPDCFGMLEGRKICGRCKSEAVRRVERGGRLETGQRSPSPWEQDKSLASLVETTRLALLSPRNFYCGLALEGSGFWSYAFAIGWPMTILSNLIAFLVAALSFGQSPFTAFGGAAAWTFLAIVMVGAPLWLAISVAVYSGVWHLFLRMLGGATGRLETTARVVGFAQSVLVFNWIPIVGPFVALIWQAVLVVVGLRDMHGTTTGKALAAVLLPLILCGGFMALMFAVAFMARPGP